jgi:hypothetical protein
VLAGSLIWNGKTWQSSWSLLMANANRHWSIEDVDYKQLINKAIDRAADTMGATYAIHGIGKDQQQATVRLQVQAVDSIQKYRKLENYLRELSAVAQITPLQVDGQSVMFDVTLRSNEEEFFNLIKNDAELIEAAPVEPQPEPEKAEPVAPEIAAPAAGEQAGGSPGIASGVVVSDTGTENSLASNQPLSDAPEKSAPQTPVYYYRLNQ